MQIKTCPVRVKAVGAAGTADEGTFEALVSVFGNVDSYGDMVVKGAFTDTLAEWAAKGDPIPVYWSHRMDDPDYNIGEVLAASETDEGLLVKAKIDLDTPKGSQVHRLLKARRVTQFSFAYEVLDAGYAKSEALGEYLELRKLNLFEVGPTPLGANDQTELLGVKRLADHVLVDVKAGRTISAKNEDELRAAHDALGRVLSTLDSGDDGKAAAGKGSTKDEGADGVKSEESASSPAASIDTLELEMALTG